MHYLYDGAQVIQQTLKTANGEALQSTEYIYEPGSFRPVAQVDTNHTLAIEKLHYVVTDHAGTPRELCAEDGDIVWRGEQSLWHRHTQTLQSNVKRLFEDAANDPVHCDLRYQGQLEDKESGLYYNLNRYYDADSGQYLSSDPIGMAGGLRPQAYVHNPMEWVDPLGLTGHENSKNTLAEQMSESDSAKVWGVLEDGTNQGVKHFNTYWEKYPERIPSLAERLRVDPNDFENTVEGFENFTKAAQNVVNNASISRTVEDKFMYFVEGAAKAKKGVAVIVKNGKIQTMMPTSPKDFAKLK